MYVLNDITSKPREQRLVTKEYIATHKNLILPVKFILQTLVIKLLKVVFYAEILTVTYTIGQSSFTRFATCTARPLLKLNRSVFLIMYN